MRVVDAATRHCGPLQAAAARQLLRGAADLAGCGAPAPHPLQAEVFLAVTPQLRWLQAAAAASANLDQAAAPAEAQRLLPQLLPRAVTLRFALVEGSKADGQQQQATHHLRGGA